MGKFPLDTQQKHQVLDLHHAVKCGEQEAASRKNLMKAHLEYRSARSMPWAVKNESSLVEVGCREHRVTTVTLGSSFLPDEPERRIPMGYCTGIRH